MRSTKRRSLVALAALSLVVAACGDDEDDASSTEAPAATEAEGTEAAGTEAMSTEAESTEAESTEAMSTEAESTEPMDTEAESTEVESTEAESTESMGTEAESTDAESTESMGTEAESTEAESTEAESTESTGTEVESTESESTEPMGTDVESTESEGTEPMGTESMGTEPSGTEAAGSMAPVTPGEDWPDTLTFTLTPSQDTGTLIDDAQPLADMLSERLGGIPVEAFVPTDYAGVIAALDSGQAQIAGGLGPAQMVQAESQADATMILQSVRFGSTLYVTQWFTNDPDTFCEDEPAPAGDDGFLFCNGVGEAESAEDGPIGEDMLAQVEGKTVAFVDQGSASGYLVPAFQLFNAGVDPIDGITTVFAGAHDQAVQAVYDGDADVGVSFNDARGQLVETTPDVGERVVVFGWSGPIPNDGFAVAGDLPEDLQQAITDAFLDIANSEEGAAVLDELYEIEGLVPVESSDYDEIRDLETELGELLD